MASNLLKITASYFESRECHYKIVDEEEEVMSASYSMDNRDGLTVYMFFNDEASTVKARAVDITKFPENKKEMMYKVCNTLNADYRFLKFFVDESDNTITADIDAIVDMDTVGEEVFRLAIKVANIVDEAYPDMQKAIWA